jgi:2-keto-3-deoxy-L-rhamnonate aldolase RhmA
MQKNKLRELLRSGQPSIGTHLHSVWPSVVEVVGATKSFDYVEFVAEYAPFDLFALENFCRAAELCSLGAMIKVDQEPRRFLAQRAIGSGFQSVLFADVRNAEDACECVNAVRPETSRDGGRYGVAPRRNTYMNQVGTADYVQALQDVVVGLMIEKQSAIDCLEEILAVPGIDFVQWGPFDYCMSVGRPGAIDAPDVRAVERKVIATCLRMGIEPRAEIESVADAEDYLNLGVKHFCIGTDLNVLFDWLRQKGTGLRDTICQHHSGGTGIGFQQNTAL